MCSSPADADRYLIMTQPARIEGTPYLHEISPPENELVMRLVHRASGPPPARLCQRWPRMWSTR